MGMFDIIHIECPSCGEQVYFQSKAGDCIMNGFLLCNIPPKIAADLDGKSEVCECGKTLTIKTQCVVSVTVT